MKSPAITQLLMLAIGLMIITGRMLAAIFLSSLQGPDPVWQITWIPRAGFVGLMVRG